VHALTLHLKGEKDRGRRRREEGKKGSNNFFLFLYSLKTPLSGYSAGPGKKGKKDAFLRPKEGGKDRFRRQREKIKRQYRVEGDANSLLESIGERRGGGYTYSEPSALGD